MRRPLVPILLLLPFAVLAQQIGTPPAGTYISFNACPIARDTGPDTDLCFLTEFQGVGYALTNPPDWGQAQLKHRVLVEGQVVDGPLVCGAVALEGRFSVLAELDESCNQILPFDGEIRGSIGGIFNRGTPQQRAAAMELAERVEQNPELSILPVTPEPPAAPVPAPPYTPQILTLYFPFDSDRGSGPDMLEVVNLVGYAKAANAGISIVSYGGETLVSSGVTLREKAGMARQRAEKMLAILTGLGLREEQVQLQWSEELLVGDGREDWKNRRVEIYLEP